MNIHLLVLEELKKRNSELETELRELEMIKAENVTLQNYMNLKQKYSIYILFAVFLIVKSESV